MGSVRPEVGTVLRFGEEFELDLRAYELRRAGQSLKLPRIPMELLLLLVEQRGQLVTREQIIEHIWGKEVFVDTDNSINAAIRKVRQALADNPEQPRFVQTVTAKGYRFIAPVQTIDPSIEQVPAAPDVSEPRASNFVEHELPSLRSGTKLRLLVFAGFVGLILTGGAYWTWFRSHQRVAPPGRAMLAVLPFENLTGDSGQDYFIDGMTEELIARTGNLDPEHLGVIARTSVMHYRNTQEKLDQIARELGVQYVLEGSVRKDAGKVRINAELIQISGETPLWVRQYDREVGKVLELQEEIAREISDEIEGTFGNHPPRKPPPPDSSSPSSYEAYDLYLKGQYFWNQRTPDALRRAIEYFQQAIDKDPQYARAYAGLADTYALLGGYTQSPQKEFMSKARAAALRAIELDESLPEAHTALALIVQNYDWDWKTSEREFLRSIELNPNYATGHHWYAEHLAWLGRFDEALKESQRAQQLDPLSLIIATDKGAIFYYKRDYDAAIAQFRAVRELDPNFPRAGVIRLVYAQKEMFAEILAEHEQIRRKDGDAPWIWSESAYVYGRTGRMAQARHEVAKLEEWNRQHPFDPDLLVRASIGMGENDRAFLWLEKAYEQHSNVLTTLKVDPVFDPLRSDPRFAELTRRVGLTN